MFPVCLSVALPRVLHIVLQDDVWRRRRSNTVAIVSHFSFSVLIKGRDARTRSHWHVCLHKRLINSYKSTFPRFFFKACTFVPFFFFFSLIFYPPPPTPPLLYARSVQPLTTVAMAARACSTERNRNYRNKCKLQHFVEYSEMTANAADLWTTSWDPPGMSFIPAFLVTNQKTRIETIVG